MTRRVISIKSFKALYLGRPWAILIWQCWPGLLPSYVACYLPCWLALALPSSFLSWWWCLVPPEILLILRAQKFCLILWSHATGYSALYLTNQEVIENKFVYNAESYQNPGQIQATQAHLKLRTNRVTSQGVLANMKLKEVDTTPFPKHLGLEIIAARKQET